MNIIKEHFQQKNFLSLSKSNVDIFNPALHILQESKYSRIYITYLKCYYITCFVIKINHIVMQKRSVKDALVSQKPSKTIKIVQDRYEIKNIWLGQGSYGEVSVCWDRNLFQVLAVKTISKAKILEKINKSQKKDSARKFYVKSLRDEAFLMEKICHPNVVRFHGHSETDTNIYFFLEYCNQGTLEALIKKEGKVPIEVAVPMMRQLLSALIYLHNNLICHRDIKPQNILLHQGKAKIGDFGFACNIKDSKDIVSTFRVGTPQYMAPQTIEDNRFGLKSDVWSLGVTFYRMICGDHPWGSWNNDKEWLSKIKDLPVINNSQAPLWLKSIISKMLAFNDFLRPDPSEIYHYFNH